MPYLVIEGPADERNKIFKKFDEHEEKCPKLNGERVHVPL
jgi:hypothetical protein